MVTIPAGSRVLSAVELLRARRERVTPARLAVLEVLDATEEHLSADEIVELVARRATGVHRATVYRALSTLGDLQLVTHTHVGGSAAVYHMSVPDTREQTSRVHAHLQCTACGRVIDAPLDALGPLRVLLERELGFDLQPEHAALLGICAECR